MCDDYLPLTLHKKTLKPSKKNVSIARINEKKLHTLEFELKCISRNMRCKLLKKKSSGKIRVFQTLAKYRHWKRYFFRTNAFFKYLWSILRLFQKYSLHWYYAILFLHQNYVTPTPQQNFTISLFVSIEIILPYITNFPELYNAKAIKKKQAKKKSWNFSDVKIC